mmetsp:Transcript_5029/g.7656  ORF Transcript_5029/g.7656 Transcript_5029/m.7656 type:complete len:154 (+) Transcript_5029:880-1341(+)
MGGCAVPDDELRTIVGDAFSLVMDKMGIANRQTLAASHEAEYDGGPWAPYIELWIEKAQALEIQDIMADVVGGVDNQAKVLEYLRRLKIATPIDITACTVQQIAQKFVDGIDDFQPSGEMIEAWQERSKKKLQDIPWLEKWSAAYTTSNQNPP